MADEYVVSRADLTAVADALRANGGTSEALAFPEGFVEASNATGSMLSGILNGSLTDYVHPAGVSTVYWYLFYDRSKLKSADLRNVTSSVMKYAFYSCGGLESVIMPGEEGSIFLQDYTFGSCTSLKEFEAACTIKWSSNATNTFNGCTSLSRVSMRKTALTTSVRQTFYGCTALAFADIGNTSGISNQCFYNCKALTTLILRRTAGVATLSSVNAFSGTPFASGGSGGTIYVPEALIENYKKATNWATLYNAGTVTFLPIEGSEYE